MGVSVEILAPHDPGCKHNETWGGIRIHRFPYFFPLQYQRLCYGSGILKNIRGNPLAAVQLPLLMLAEIAHAAVRTRIARADLIHAHWSLPQGMVALLIRKTMGVPYILTLHGSDIFGLNQRLVKSLNALTIKGARRCTANSRATAHMARKIFWREDLEIIPMGVDTDVFRRILNSEVGWKDKRTDEKVILFVGRLIEWKGVEYLLRSLPKVLGRYPRVKAMIVGTGPQRHRLIDLSVRLGIENRVVFVGNTPQTELPQFYSAADVFVLPSIVNDRGETEGLGVVLLEAMACGTPVVGSNVGGIPDIIKDEQTGLLAREKDPEDLASKILRVFDDQNLRQRMIEKGLAFVRMNFSWRSVADRFLNLYLEVSWKSRERT
jgi:glycosyltransferase involved in cell wall biosynthesis